MNGFLSPLPLSHCLMLTRSLRVLGLAFLGVAGGEPPAWGVQTPAAPGTPVEIAGDRPASQPLTLAQLTQVEPAPRPLLPPPEELLEPRPEIPQFQVPSPGEPPDRPPEDGEAAMITVDRFEVVGSTVFSEAELQAVLAPYIGRPLTLAELLAARTAVTQLYVDQGYVSSGAYIPPQTPESGTVIIQVIEGRLADIQVQGTRRLNQNYVRSRLALAAEPPLRVDRLVDALRLLQLDPLIENISGELSAGVEPGTNQLTVTVAEADSFDIDFVTRNNRSAAIGSWEQGIFFNEGNLTGNGDGLQLGYQRTQGSDRLILDYQFPINPRSDTVGFHFEYTDSEIIRAPANVLDINTDSILLDLSYRRSLIRTPTEELAFTLTSSWNRSRSVFLEDLIGTAIPFPAFGSNDNGETVVHTLRFAQDWVKRGRSDLVAVRSQFNLGIGGTTPSSLTPDAPDASFFSWLVQGQWARLLAPDTLLLVRGEAQLATDTLPSSELFGLGGQSTVRGYGQNRLLTDNAAFATAEVRFPLLRDRDRQGLLQIIPFFDLGLGWNTRLANPDRNTLLGTGLGLLWTEGDYWNARLDWGIPLNGGETGNTWQESGIYFSLGLNRF